MEEEVRILCVDDEPNVLSALRRLFLDNDYTILTATSGEEGLKILDQERVQLVVSDYRMPGMNGVEFLKQVRKVRPDTIRMVLSGYADAAAIVAAVNEGQIYKFVPKPWNDDELKFTVAHAIERYFLYKRNVELTSELQAKNEELTKLNDELKKLLAEKSESLKFRSEVLVAHQRILDSIPVGIMGIDFSDVVVLYNSRWTEYNKWCLLGHHISDAAPEDLKVFIEELKNGNGAAKRVDLPGVSGRLLGSVMNHQGNQRGIIIAFVREEDIDV